MLVELLGSRSLGQDRGEDRDPGREHMATSPPPQGKGSLVGEVREIRGPGVLGWLPAWTLVWLMRTSNPSGVPKTLISPPDPCHYNACQLLSIHPGWDRQGHRETHRSPAPYLTPEALPTWPGMPLGSTPSATPAWGWILFFLYCFLRLSPQAPGLPRPGPPTNDLSLAPKAACPPPGHVGDVRHLWGFWEPPPIRRGGGRGPTIACCWVLPL